MPYKILLALVVMLAVAGPAAAADLDGLAQEWDSFTVDRVIHARANVFSSGAPGYWQPEFSETLIVAAVDASCSIKVTCNEDGTADATITGCSPEQFEKIAKAIQDICAV